MSYVLTSLSGNLISAASAGYAPTNSAEVSAIASAYQVVSATATQLNAGTAYVTSINDTPLSAARAGNAANASLANSAWYDGTGRMISALPDEATVSSIASAYAESAASSKQDTLSFSYDDGKISAINGSALAGQGGGGLVTAIGTSTSGITSINNSGLVDTAALRSADYSSLYVQEPLYISASGDSSYIGISGDVGGVDSATCSAIASAYAESAVSGKADSSAMSSYVPYSSLEYNTASAISGINGSALAAGSTYSAGEGIDITDDVISVEAPVDIVAGPGIVIDNPDGNTLRVSMAQDVETVLWDNPNGQSTGQLSLSESPLNFEYVAVYAQAKNPTGADGFNHGNFGQFYNRMLSTTLKNQNGFVDYAHMDGNNTTSSFTWYSLTTKWSGASTTTWTWARTELNGNSVNDWYYMLRIVGIHRIQGGN